MRIFRGHKAPFRGVAYLPDGSGLVSASKDGVVKVWDLESGTERAEFQLTLPDPFRAIDLDRLAVSPSDGTVAVAGCSVVLWNPVTGESRTLAFQNPSESNTLAGLVFTPDGRQLLAGMFWMRSFGGVWAWDTLTGERAFPLLQVPHQVWALAVAPQSETLATASPEGIVEVWELVTGERKWAWTPLWSGLAHALAFSRDGRVLALASKQSVWLFDVPSGRQLANWQVHPKHHVGTLCFSPDGRLLATGGNDRFVRFWSMEEIASPPKMCAAYDWGLGKGRSVAFAPDGMTAAAVGDNRKIVVWDVEG